MSELNRVLKLPEVMAATQQKKTVIYSLMKKGDFPKQVKLTSRSVGWMFSDINEYLELLSVGERWADREVDT